MFLLPLPVSCLHFLLFPCNFQWWLVFFWLIISLLFLQLVKNKLINFNLTQEHICTFVLTTHFPEKRSKANMSRRLWASLCRFLVWFISFVRGSGCFLMCLVLLRLRSSVCKIVCRICSDKYLGESSVFSGFSLCSDQQVELL